MSGLYDDDFSSAPSVVTPIPAPTTGSLYGEDDTATTPVPLGESMSLVSDEAKAAAKAGVKQVSQVASVATAGLKTKFTELRGQPIGTACKKVCVGIAVLTILACGGLKWWAHQPIGKPVEPAQPTIASVQKAAPVMVATAAALTVAPPPVVAAVKPNPLAPKSFNPQSPNYRATGVTVAVPTTQAPAVGAQPKAIPLAPKSFNPMSPNYHAPGASAAVSAPVAAAPAAATVTKTARPSLAPKSFNPQSPNYKPVPAAAKTQWETEQDQKLNSYFHKATPGG